MHAVIYVQKSFGPFFYAFAFTLCNSAYSVVSRF